MSQEQRATEIRLLKEHEAAGKIIKLKYVSPEDVDLSTEEEDNIDDKLRSRSWNPYKQDLGDGNFRHYHRPKE